MESSEPGVRLAATFVLTGLLVPSELVAPMFQGLQIMRESSTYQAILAEGRDEGRKEGRKEGRNEGRIETFQKMILRQGEIRFGPPDAATQQAVTSITNADRLERMSERVVTAATWEEVLATT